MKNQLLVYASLVSIFVIYNLFFQVADERTHHLINILFSSFLFLYIAYLAFLAIRKIKKVSKKQ